MLIKILMLICFFAVMLGVGFLCRRKATDVSGFVLGGRSIGPWMTAFAYGTSYFSAVIFVGYAGQFGWRFGVSAAWIGVANALFGSFLAWIILGRRTRRMTQRLGSSTMPQFFGARYGSRSLKIAAAVIAFVFLVPYTASLYNGLSRLFEMAFGVDYTVCIVIMSILTCIYVVVGGYMATAVNDFIQGIIMLFGIVAVVLAVLHQNGGLAEALASLGEITDPAISAAKGDFTSLFGPDPFSLVAVMLLTSLGTWGLPQMVGKFYAIKDDKAIGKGTLVSTVFALVVAGGCYFLGGFGRLTDINVASEGYDAIIPAMISKLPDVLIGIVVILVLSASMSTLSSLVLTSSSTLTLDLLSGHIVREMKERQKVLAMRILVAVFIAISAVIAIIQHKLSIAFIAQMMGLSWGALAGAFLAPFLYGLWWKRTTKAAVWASFGFGCLNMLLNMLVPAIYPSWLASPISCGAFTMLVGLILVPAVSLLTPAPDPDQTAAAFLSTD